MCLINVAMKNKKNFMTAVMILEILINCYDNSCDVILLVLREKLIFDCRDKGQSAEKYFVRKCNTFVLIVWSIKH